MRWRLVIACGALVACQPGHGSDPCTLACSDGLVCRYDACVPPPVACAPSTGCTGDQYCDAKAMECLPWGVGPGGTSDRTCAGLAAPGMFFPRVQCDWLGPPPGDAFPGHVHVLSTPAVALLDDPTTPSIVFTSYNLNGDRATVSCTSSDPRYFGVIRIVDGRTCQQRATLGAPAVIGVGALAIADLGGDDATPEIVAARSQGGLVAFTHRSTGWQVMWQTASTLARGLCNWTGPVIRDLDGDGRPEVIFYGAVYDGRTGATIDEAIAPLDDSIGADYVPVVADIDGDGAPELVTGINLYNWDTETRRWTTKRRMPGPRGLVAVGDLGTFPAIGQDDRSHADGVDEVAVAFEGVVHVYNTVGREVFVASVRRPPGVTIRQSGPLTIADVDGDGRAEIGVAVFDSYQVLDPDCQGIPDPEVCASRSSDGVLWTQPAQNLGNDLGRSSVFDVDGDGLAEVAFSDRCFTRLYDGTTGQVVYSRPRTSCSWYEDPVIADTDGDANAELVTASTASCTVPCPAIDPLFDGAACVDDGDCGGATRCVREQRGDVLGRCRCTRDADCGAGYACSDPIAGPSPAGKVCRASRVAMAPGGVHVLADSVDRWIASPIARSIASPSARSIASPAPHRIASGDPAGRAEPDLTVRQAKVTCDPAGPLVTAEVCNRGSLPALAGLPVAVYAATTPSRLRCQARTTEPLAPGRCTAVSCTWLGPAGDGAIMVDDHGDGGGVVRECREDNNLLSFRVDCP